MALFLVVERFPNGDPSAVGARFREKGRMLPDGLTYLDSWMSVSGDRCFQLMETERPELLEAWASGWRDLVDIEFTEIQSSADYWAKA